MRRLRLVTLAVVAVGAFAPTASAGNLVRYPTKYYDIYTDLGPETVREAAARMTAMAEEYHQRTKDFARTMRKRLPFYLFSKRDAYYAAGGPRGSGGVYSGDKLMAIASSRNVWHVVQHEGWHQFVHRAIGGRIPIWVNEGLAEYFGEGIWTGDAFVTGVIPPRRLRSVQSAVKAGKFAAFEDMMSMSSKEWMADIRRTNYDQAWSMAHFLVHAEEGRYRKAFSRFIADISRGRPWTRSWKTRFGGNISAFQKRFERWWLDRKPDATAALYTKAVVQTLTSFLARAHQRGMEFEDADAFFDAAIKGKIKMDPETDKEDWLPRNLLLGALKPARRMKKWSLINPRRAGLPRLQLRVGRVTYTGQFTLPTRGRPDTEVKITGESRAIAGGEFRRADSRRRGQCTARGAGGTIGFRRRRLSQLSAGSSRSRPVGSGTMREISPSRSTMYSSPARSSPKEVIWSIDPASGVRSPVRSMKSVFVVPSQRKFQTRPKMKSPKR